MVSPQDRIVADGDVLSTEVDGEVLMMDVDSGNYYGLDAIGSEIWRRLATPTEVAALCGQLEEEFDAPAAVIRRDVLALLDRLLEKKLIRVVG